MYKLALIAFVHVLELMEHELIGRHGNHVLFNVVLEYKREQGQVIFQNSGIKISVVIKHIWLKGLKTGLAVKDKKKVHLVLSLNTRCMWYKSNRS